MVSSHGNTMVIPWSMPVTEIRGKLETLVFNYCKINETETVFGLRGKLPPNPKVNKDPSSIIINWRHVTDYF